MFSGEEESMGTLMTTIDYLPVFTNFGLTVKTAELCPGGTLSYIDPGEVRKIPANSDKRRETLELFSLALSIFEIEGLFFYKWLLRDKLLQEPAYTPGWVGVLTVPVIIQHDIDTMVRGHRTYNLKYLMKFTLSRVGIQQVRTLQLHSGRTGE